jgi:hypothetical protein
MALETSRTSPAKDKSLMMSSKKPLPVRYGSQGLQVAALGGLVKAGQLLAAESAVSVQADYHPTPDEDYCYDRHCSC